MCVVTWFLAIFDEATFQRESDCSEKLRLPLATAPMVKTSMNASRAKNILSVWTLIA